MKVAVVGFGNILRKDDGFGVYVVNLLKENYKFEPEIDLIDAGIYSFRLMDILFDYDFLIIVDTVYTDGIPGEVVILDKKDLKNTFTRLGHDFDVSGMLEFLNPEKIFIVSATCYDCKSFQIGLSKTVKNSVDKAVGVIINKLNSLGIDSYKVGNKTIEEVIQKFG